LARRRLRAHWHADHFGGMAELANRNPGVSAAHDPKTVAA
jgi:glyoxylase-like metal-dependent hydrolase (beta-lactamase superfamily II)